MSAIFGIFQFDKQPVPREGLERMGKVLNPYGPEGNGIWIHNHVGFGQCLMHFTPEDLYEQQLLTKSKRNLVFSGRIDNRDDLMNGLGLSVGEAKLFPDSTFILLAYQKWGFDCLTKLIGRFTFALWDDKLTHLLIARSAVNGPPIFYHTTHKAVVFSSMRKGLFILPQVPRIMDEQVLANYLSGIPSDPDRGFYLNIKQLPPGHALRINPHGLHVERFWHLDLADTIQYPNDNDYIDSFNEVFSRVVNDLLRSQTPLGIMMSGGLDSSSVAAVAAPLLRTQGKNLTAFTEVPDINFDGPIIKGRYADETPYVQAIASMYDNLDLTLIRTDDQVYLDGLDNFFFASEVPFRNASNRVYIEAILRAAQEKGIRNLLTGGQGNLTISWNGSGLLPQLIQQGQIMRALREARALAWSEHHKSGIRTLVNRGLMPLLPTQIWLATRFLLHEDGSSRKAYHAKTPWQNYAPIHPDFARKHNVFDRALEIGYDFFFRQSVDTRSRRLKIIENSGKLFDGIMKGYQKIYQVETLDPTTDQRLVEFCLKLPEEQFLRSGISKWLIRRAMTDKLPEEVLWNKERGLQAADWYERLRKAKPTILETLNRMEKSDLARHAIDLPRLRRLVDVMPLTGMDPQRLMLDYRQVLEMGLMTGSFILWFETGRWR